MDFSLDEVSEDDDQPLLETLVAKGPTPQQEVERTDMALKAMQAVEKLPVVQREVFLMRVQGDLPFHEIAKILNVPLNTALGRMHDATTRLKQMLTKEMM
jgi:RNA polymerase sigma-70 factor (ECF subfamily)